jgi:hypothetical protein
LRIIQTVLAASLIPSPTNVEQIVTRGLEAAQGGARTPPPRRSGASASRDGSVGVGAMAEDSNVL